MDIVSADRVEMTAAAADMLRTLRDRHGPLLIHQSGGCCDGSAPMCFAIDDFRVPESDVRLGVLDLGPAPSGEPGDGDAVPVWVDSGEFRVWEHSRLILDLVPGRAAGFSLDSASTTSSCSSASRCSSGAEMAQCRS